MIRSSTLQSLFSWMFRKRKLGPR